MIPPNENVADCFVTSLFSYDAEFCCLKEDEKEKSHLADSAREYTLLRLLYHSAFHGINVNVHNVLCFNFTNPYCWHAEETGIQFLTVPKVVKPI